MSKPEWVTNDSGCHLILGHVCVLIVEAEHDKQGAWVYRIGIQDFGTSDNAIFDTELYEYSEAGLADAKENALVFAHDLLTEALDDLGIGY